MARNRSVLFIDGNNWYHGLKALGVDSGELNYRRVAQKLLIGRDLRQIRYYVGKISGDRRRIQDQEQFLRRLQLQEVEVCLGRVEKNWMSPGHNLTVEGLKKVLVESRPDILQQFWRS